MSSSLRDELLGVVEREPAPPFVLLLPPGWVSVEPSREAFSRLTAEASAVFRAQHRPDLDAEFRAMVQRAADEFLRRDPVRLIYQEHVQPELMLPLAITAARVTDPGGASLDGRVRALVRDQGARPLDELGVMMRWSAEHRHDVPGGRVTTRSFNYLVPVPGTGRTQALMFTGTLPVGAGEQLDEGTISSTELLMDAIMSTFRWSGE